MPKPHITLTVEERRRRSEFNQVFIRRFAMSVTVEAEEWKMIEIIFKYHPSPSFGCCFDDDAWNLANMVHASGIGIVHDLYGRAATIKAAKELSDSLMAQVAVLDAVVRRLKEPYGPRY